MEKDAQLSIGEMSEATGVTPRTIRFYVSEGLIAPPVGTGLYRYYGYEQFIRIRFIKLFQGKGLPLRQIKLELSRISLSEMEDLLKLGEAIMLREASGDRVKPGEVLAALLGPPAREDVRADASDTVMLRQSPDVFEAEECSPSSVGLWRRLSIVPGVELSYEVTRDSNQKRKMESAAAELTRILQNNVDD